MMKLLFRLCGLCALLFCLPAAFGQAGEIKVSRVDIKHVGPAAASETLIRANIRVKNGDLYRPALVDDDVHNLYATGLFYNIRIVTERADDGGVKLLYVLQGRPRLTALKIEGNKKMKLSKIQKKVTSKVGEPLDERKLFTDGLAVKELYVKAGYPGTKVEVEPPNIDEDAGRGTATIKITESPRVRITKIEFIGAQAFKPRKLAKTMKTKKRWMWSWLTGRGTYKEDQFEDDKDALATFYRNNGYIDFDITNVVQELPTPRTMVIKMYLYEGREYKVGQVTFKGATMFPTNKVETDFKLKPGAVYVPAKLYTDMEKVEDFYGAKGYIDVNSGTGNLRVRRIPNTETGTMDLDYNVTEGQKSYVEKIEIRGNTKTKDRVIRRELAISPGEVFDMVRVKTSKRRLEGLQYFEKVDARPEPTDVPERKNLIVGVEEKNTGNFTVGAGFNSVESVVAFAEVTQGNFDLFHPPTFTGGGQKFRVRVQLGTSRQDYIVSFTEPWFLGRKLRLDTEAYIRDLNFQSQNNIYDESRVGVHVGLTKALGSDFLIGSIGYTIEEVGISLNDGFHDRRQYYNSPSTDPETGLPLGPNPPSVDPANVPQAILNEVGHSLISKMTFSLAYDTRNSTLLPDAGQRTELSADVGTDALASDKNFYKLELRSSWYFRALAKGHVLELLGRGGVADGFNGDSVPFYERWYLGGLDTLRGFNYRGVGPREVGSSFNEPIGGNTYWYGCAEYSIPVINSEKGASVRLAAFYDVGAVMGKAYDWSGAYSDDWGIGLRLNLPIGPLRLDYAFPINHDEYNGDNGRFQFGVGYTRGF